MAPCFFSGGGCERKGKNRTAAAGGSSWRRGGSDAAPGKRGGW